MFELPVVVLAAAVAGLAWIALPGLPGVAASIAGAAGTWLFVTRRVAPRLFPARASFRPSIEALRDALGERRRIDDVARGVEDVIVRWLAVTSATVELPERFAVAGLAGEALERAERGETVLADGVLLVPLHATGELRAIAKIGSKHDGAPFNDEDVALLDTIAAFGGLALHHAHVLAELDQMRRAELDAAGREKQATIALLGAEVAHEVAYSLSYLRFLLRDAGRAPSADDVEIGRDEIARLERMLGALRRLAPPSPRIATVPLIGPLRQAAVLLREQMAEHAITFELADTALIARADRDDLVQVLANLLRNAIQAAGHGGEIRMRCDEHDGAVRIRVIDSGPGVPPELGERLFTPWATGRPGGTGLGLAAAARIVRGWGGSLRYERRDDRTEFVVEIPVVPL